jgi:regulator of protease activity HflC (stomatin/prohibitin superfamily)
LQVEARGVADAEVTRAKGEAAAQLIRAEGSREAANLIAGSETAVRFAMIDKTGQALNKPGKTTFFFGCQTEGLGDTLLPALAAQGKLLEAAQRK